MDKNSLRIELRQQRAKMPRSRKKDIDKAINALVLNTPEYRQAQTIFCYCSTEDEIDTREILCDALAKRKAVCVPRCLQKGVMVACQIHVMDELFPGKYGILEPMGDCRVIPADKIDLCIVPALGADLAGYRIGYGGGYYDRFLSQTKTASMILCAQDRLFPSLPVEPFDISCDQIITERQIYIAK